MEKKGGEIHILELGKVYFLVSHVLQVGKRSMMNINDQDQGNLQSPVVINNERR
jgi:hypothetical protein